MKRSQLAHVIRAAADITGDGNMLVIGSQAVLATNDAESLPPRAVLSIEADIAFFDDPDESKADLVDGNMGEGSQFHREYGYYGQGVSLATAILPRGWRDRARTFDFGDVGSGAAVCPEVHDLAVSKLVAGREKDFDYVEALLTSGFVDATLLEERVTLLDQPGAVKRRILEWIGRRS